MARKVIVLALVLVAIFGVALAETPKETKEAPAAATAPANDDAIGNDDDGAVAGAPNDVVAGPMGSESAAAAAAAGASAESPHSSATVLKVSAATGAATVAGYFIF